MDSSYNDVFDRSLRDPEGFWSEAAQEIDWIETWNKVIDASNAPFCRWFVGGVLNTCYNAVDRHMETGRADQAALIYDSPVADTVRTYTYRELRDEVAAFAGALASRGVTKCERVIIYMPMVPELIRGFPTQPSPLKGTGARKQTRFGTGVALGFVPCKT